MVTYHRNKFFNILNYKRSNKKGKLRKNIIKKTISLALSIVTFTYGFVFLKLPNNKATTNNSSVVYANYDRLNSEYIVNGSNIKPIDLNIIKIKDIQINKESKKESVNTNMVSNNNVKIINNDKVDNHNKIHIGDIIKLNEDSKIYCNYYDSIDKINALKPYYDNSMDRYISGIVLMINGSIDCYTNQEQIDYLLDNGAKIVTYMSSNDYGCEGFYNNDNDKIKLKI